MSFIPKNFKQYFWDTELSQLTKNNKNQILDRLLEYGDGEAVKWCYENFTKDEIIECIKRSRKLSRKSANFWALIFNIPKNQVLCLSRSYRKKQKILWRY